MKLRFRLELAELVEGDERSWVIHREEADAERYAMDLEAVVVQHARSCARGLMKTVLEEGPPGNPVQVHDDLRLLVRGLCAADADPLATGLGWQRFVATLHNVLDPVTISEMNAALERHRPCTACWLPAYACTCKTKEGDA